MCISNSSPLHGGEDFSLKIMARDKDDIIRVVHHGLNLGPMTWGEFKLRAARHQARIVKGDQTASPPVFCLVGGVNKPRRG